MKDCYCYTCSKAMHRLGVARHRAMHREKKTDCKIKFSGGQIFSWSYAPPPNQKEQTND